MALLCKTCLASNVKMFKLSAKLNICDMFISQAYFDVTGISDSGPQDLVCFECIYMLRKFVKFKRKCLKANEILKKQPLAKETITTKRKEYSLGLSLEYLPAMIVNIDPEITYQMLSVNVDDIKKENFETSADAIIKSEIELPLARCRTERNPLFTYVYVNKGQIDGNINEHDSKDDKQCSPLLSPAEGISDDSLHEVTVDTIKEKEEIPRRKRKQATKKAIQKRKVKIKNNLSLIIDSKVSKHSNEKSDAEMIDLDKKNKQGNLKFDQSYFEGFAKLVVLTDEEAKKEVESRKESDSYLKSPFKCTLCYKAFQIEKAYEDHKERHSPKDGAHECEFCHLRFTSEQRLRKHKTVYHRWKFCCVLCPYVSHRKFQARIHMDVHKGVKVQCDICKGMFSDPNSMLKHKRNKHDSVSVCEICGSTFPTVRGLSTHTALCHSQEKNERKGPKCDDCGVHFSTELAWKRHLVLSTKHEISNGCDICGETFPDPETLKTHSKTHNRLKYAKSLPGACDICDTWLETKVDYNEHMTSQHPESVAAKRIQTEESLPYVCEFCGKGFKQPSFLLYHQRKHTGERPYECKVCGKTFAFPATFSQHKRTHKTGNTLKRVYKCELCEKTLSSGSALAKHVKASHLNIRPHKCNVCGKAFPNPCEVKYHIQYVHCKVPWPKRDRSKRNKAVAEQKNESC